MSEVPPRVPQVIFDSIGEKVYPIKDGHHRQSYPDWQTLWQAILNGDVEHFDVLDGHFAHYVCHIRKTSNGWELYTLTNDFQRLRGRSAESKPELLAIIGWLANADIKRVRGVVEQSKDTTQAIQNTLSRLYNAYRQAVIALVDMGFTDDRIPLAQTVANMYAPYSPWNEPIDRYTVEVGKNQVGKKVVRIYKEYDMIREVTVE